MSSTQRFNKARGLLSGLRHLTVAVTCALSCGLQADTAAVERMAQALRLATVSYQDAKQIDYAQFDAFIALLRRNYPRVFSSLDIELISGYSLLIIWPGSDSTLNPVLFDAHYDVVPIEPGTAADWQHPPFAGVVDDGYLWGRGALDDKFAVITYLEAVERLLASGFTPARSLYFSLVHDEEIGGYQGAARVAEELQARKKKFAYMVGEGGMLLDQAELLDGQTMAMIALAEKTYVTLTLSCRGDGGHSSMPPANNAAARLAAAVARIHHNPLPAALAAPVTDMLNTLGALRGGFDGWMMRNQWASGWLLKKQMAKERSNNALVRSTAAVTMLHSGVKENVVPQQASATVNMRLLPGVQVADAVASIREIIDDEAIVVAVESWGQAPPVADIHAEGYQRIERAIQREFSDAAVVPGLLVATTDTRHYQALADNIYRFRAYRLPLSDAASIHATNERIAVQSFLQAIQFSEQLIRQVAEQD